MTRYRFLKWRIYNKRIYNKRISTKNYFVAYFHLLSNLAYNQNFKFLQLLQWWLPLGALLPQYLDDKDGSMDKCKELGDLRSIRKRNVTLSLNSFPTLFTSSCWIFLSFWNWCKVVKVSSWFHESFILSFANKTSDDVFSEVDKVREISVCGELSV